MTPSNYTARAATHDKLYVLHMTFANGTFTSNLNYLCGELDRGWAIAGYEVIVPDPQGATTVSCNVLITLRAAIGVPAIRPKQPPVSLPSEKFFLLEVAYNTAVQSNSNYAENSAQLWAELDRGWRIAGYEVLVADFPSEVCFVLVKLTSNGQVPASVSPSTQPPAHEKLLILSRQPSMANQYSMHQLWSEIDRGWRVVGYDVVLTAAGGEFFALVKMTSDGATGTLINFTSNGVFQTNSTAGLSLGEWVTVDNVADASRNNTWQIIALTAQTFTVTCTSPPIAMTSSAPATWTSNVPAEPPIVTGKLSYLVSDTQTLLVTTDTTQGLSVGEVIQLSVDYYPEVSNAFSIIGLTNTTIKMTAATQFSTPGINITGNWSLPT